MDYKAKQAAQAAAVAALVACNPHLVPAASCKGGSLIAAAKNIRIELGLAFPGVKFSIKSRRFSMGDAIDVSWIDGPTGAQVDEIIDRYSAGSFNGMDDSYTYSRDFWIKAFGDAKYVHSRRDMSDAAIGRAIRTGELPASRRAGKWLILAEDAAKWAATGDRPRVRARRDLPERTPARPRETPGSLALLKGAGKAA